MSDLSWGRWSPSTCDAPRALALAALPEEFLLWTAARDGDTSAVAFLLMDFGGLHIDDTYEGWTSLFKALESNRSDALALLICAEADVNATTKKGRNTTSIAAGLPNGSAPAVESLLLLLGVGANPAARDEKGWSAIRYAAEGSSPALAFALAQDDPVQSVNAYLESLSQAGPSGFSGPSAPPPSQQTPRAEKRRRSRSSNRRSRPSHAAPGTRAELPESERRL